MQGHLGLFMRLVDTFEGVFFWRQASFTFNTQHVGRDYYCPINTVCAAAPYYTMITARLHIFGCCSNDLRWKSMANVLLRWVLLYMRACPFKNPLIKLKLTTLLPDLLHFDAQNPSPEIDKRLFYQSCDIYAGKNTNLRVITDLHRLYQKLSDFDMRACLFSKK